MNSLLILAATWPEPESSAAGARLLQLISLFLEENWKITLLCAAEKRPHSAALPPDIHTRPLSLNDSRMDPVFHRLQPDAVLFDRFMLEEQYGWRIETQCPAALRILDTVDLHSLREIRRRALNEGRDRVFKDWYCDTALRELSAIHRSDLSLLISDAEHEILTRELRIPEPLLQVIPFLLDEEDLQNAGVRPGFAARRDFSCIGNFRHPPNADSVRHLHREIWPRLRKRCPEAQLKIYGADLTPAIQQLHQPRNGFHICGRAEDAQAVMRGARVCLAPLRFGAGLKGKLLDAMRAGTPSVTTSIGAEGMQGEFPWPGAVADTPEAFVDAAVRLYTQREAWEQAQKQISPLLKERFDRNRFAGPFKQRLETLLQTPRPADPDHLTGALLRHHQHRSTEYMSRWIEAKNRSV